MLNVNNSISIVSSRFSLVDSTGEAISPLTRHEQIYDYGFARWTALLTSPPMRREIANEWIAFLVEQAGMIGQFEVSDPLYICKLPAATVTLSGAVNRGAMAASLAGLPSADLLRAGAYVTIDRQMVMLTADAADVGGGLTAIKFVPAIRTATASGAACNVETPTSIMRLVDDDQARWTTTAGLFYTASAACAEVL